MSNKKQSSVRFIIKEISDILGEMETNTIQNLLLFDAMRRAKEIHKEEIMNAYSQGVTHSVTDVKLIDCSKYYNEKFGGNNE